MTPEFRTALREIKLTARQFAALVGVTPNTVTNWGNAPHGRRVQEVPRWAWMLVKVWRNHPDILLAEVQALEKNIKTVDISC